MAAWRRLKSLLLRCRSPQSVYDLVTGVGDVTWSRVVMRERCREWLRNLEPGKLSALEISGELWKGMGFGSYRSVSYPEYDVCAGTLPERFEVIIAEQVFEHLLWPYRAGRNVYEMLKPGGHFLISTPFLVKIHNVPIDCSRWTETGLKYLLAECGFPLEDIRTDSWGNKACVKASFRGWVPYRRRLHSLANEPEFPYHVWALARKAVGSQKSDEPAQTS
jgi:SAM-dependent methyltransferase